MRSIFVLASILVLVHGMFTVPATARVMIYVDLGAQEMTVTKDNGDTLVWKVSSGRDGFETPTGSFAVQRLDANHFSDEYDHSPMPYSIFFSEGVAIHGTHYRGLGHPASHGCVRLSIPHARILYSWVERYGASIEISGAASQLSNIDGDTDAGRGSGRQRSKRRSHDPLYSPWETDYPPE
jgi:lipoprotein-anchoring transpeptidase ErfK/SrfK